MLEENTIKELLDTLDSIEVIEIKNLYELLILKSIEENNRGLYNNIYTEMHHIVPRCMGGSDSPENLVKLTVINHIKAHVLLSRMYPDNEKLKYAVFATTLYSEISNKARITTILDMDLDVISRIKEDAVIARRGKRLSIETRKKMSDSHKGENNHFYGKHHTEEVKNKLSKINTGKHHSEESIKKNLFGKSRQDSF